jgi:hypothetical protein
MVAGMFGMVDSVRVMAARQMRMVRRLLVLRGAMMLRCLTVMLRSGLMMLGGLFAISADRLASMICLLCGERLARTRDMTPRDDRQADGPMTVRISVRWRSNDDRAELCDNRHIALIGCADAFIRCWLSAPPARQDVR